MNALVRKEFRLILPAWAVALVALVAVPTGFGTGVIEVPQVCMFSFWLGMLTLGLSPFGREFSSGSFSSLLAQPFPRERLWRAKIRHLSSAALTLFCVFPLLWANRPLFYRGPDWNIFWVTACAGLAVLSGGLWTTLLLRQITGAFWITLLIPAALALGVSLVTEWLVLRLANVLPAATPSLERIIPTAISAVFVLYSIAGYWWARRLFLRAQDVGWTPAEIMLPGSVRWFKSGARSAGEPRRRPWGALAVKELQLHSLSLFFAAGVLALHLAAIGVRKFGSESSAWRGPATVAFVFWFILPLIAGAEAVASERQLGTMEGQLCLPARRRTQFALKLLFTLAMSLILGGVMPWLLEHAARAAGIASEWETTRTALCLFSAFGTLLALVSFYASSLTRGTLQALGGALVAVIAVWMLADWVRPDVDVGKHLWRWGLAHLIGGPTLAVTLIGLSYWNFKRLHHARQLWRRNLAALAAWLAITVTATPLVYHRTWELVLPLEPKHGPARIPSNGRVELCFASGRAFILLPDRRLWISTEAAFVPETGKFRPLAGEFIEGSNWIAVAATHAQAAAIQADGSLWTVSDQSQVYWLQNKHRVMGAAQESPTRIGTASDWRSLSAESGHFLALKQDGSIWGWGDNSHNQLGEGPKQFTNGPVRIGDESDWTAVFASGLGSAAVKRDGSVWMWGGLYHLPDGTTLKQILRQPTPIRWNLPGTNLVSLHSIWAGELALYRDGSVWAVGGVPRSLLNDPTAKPGSEANWWEVAPVVVTPVRINPDGNWRGIASGVPFVAVHADGSLWRQDDWWKPREFSRPKEVGDNRDWLAATVRDQALLTLAADGTLCGWAPQSEYGQMTALLGPTRRPLWSLNILHATESK